MMIALLCLSFGGQAWAWDGSGTSEDPYRIQTTGDWQTLAADVKGGDGYSGKVFRMTADIDASGVTVGDDSHPFSGTFDGDKHTLTFNRGTEKNPVDKDNAPFACLNGASIMHLNVAGVIYTEKMYAAGIASRVKGSNPTYLFDCQSAVFINTFVDRDSYHGGLLGEVERGSAEVTIERCAFTGSIQATTSPFVMDPINCGGFVGHTYVSITMRNCLFDPQNEAASQYWEDDDDHKTFIDGSTFAIRAVDAAKLTLEACYATMHMFTQQGEFITDEVVLPSGFTYTFVGEPDVTLNGKKYYKNGCYIDITAPSGAFNHWESSTYCFISDPWTKGGRHQLKDLVTKPVLKVSTSKIPGPETQRTLWGVTYRYLSRQDYHYYISDEDVEALGWRFEGGKDDSNMIVYNGDGEVAEITAIVDYYEPDYNSDGVQIHNDLVSIIPARNHTHLGVIAPHAFRDSKKLETIYFKDTGSDASARTNFKFFIGEGAFEGCTKFRELKMMQYTTEGTNHWEALKPEQVLSISDDAFKGCSDLRISVQADKYQDYMKSATWKAHRNRFIIYEATTNDFEEYGVQYHYYRSFDQKKDLKNDDDGKKAMLEQIGAWNTQYQQFNAASLLETKDGCNVYYTSVVGVDDDAIDGQGGVMKIYNDPGGYYNYKTIALQRDAIAGNTHVKYIEFYQTDGRSENSFSDLKMVIPNGALKGCKNLKELRMFYYVEDGDDRWTALGPKDVIPGDNIFGLLTNEERVGMSAAAIEAADKNRPTDFRILVAPEMYHDFLNDPNWQNYLAFIEPVDFSPAPRKDFTEGGLTYSYMTAPGGIMQASQVVSQDVSWWTAARIGIEAALTIYSVASWAVKQGATAGATDAAIAATREFSEMETTLAAHSEEMTLLATHRVAVESASFANENVMEASIDALLKFSKIKAGFYIDYSKALPKALFDQLVEAKIVSSGGNFIATKEVLQGATAANLIILRDAMKTACVEAHRFAINSVQLGEAAIVGLEQKMRTALARQMLVRQLDFVSARALNFKDVLTQAGRLANVINPISVSSSTAGYIASQCWGGTGSYNAEMMNKGMRENILSNIHQVGLVGGGYVITTPQKNLVYHTFIKSVSSSTTNAVIYAGFDDDGDRNTSNRTMTFLPTVFRNKTNLKSVKFHGTEDQSSNTGMAMLITIPDSAFTGCTALTEFSTLLETKENGTRALGPENFILAGDSVFAGLDPATFHIVIDPSRKQDFLASESWAPLSKFFTYKDAAPAGKYKEYGANYAYAYENNSIKKENKVSGHLIEHTIVVGPDDDFIKGHQGAVKLCNDIGVYNNYQLDYVMPKAFKDNKNLRSVSFTDLYGLGATGDCYTDLSVTLCDSAFMGCTNLANLDLVYMVTDGENHLDPLTPQMVRIGKGVFEGTSARLKMMPQQVAWFEADSTWAAYKDRFMPCVVRLTDPGIKEALKPMAYYDPANTGTDQSTWDDFADYARIGGAGFSWLNGKFTAQKEKIHSFADFRWFESVGLDYVGDTWFEGCAKLGNIVLPRTLTLIGSKAFKGCSSLREIEIPMGVEEIKQQAFDGCTSLNTIVVRDSIPAVLGNNAFHKHSGLKIYVPQPRVNDYKRRWSAYADYIYGDREYAVNKVVTVTAVGQLADKLGLTLKKENSKIRYIEGPYAKYDSLTVIGPLNGDDVGVLRHLMGANAWESEYTDGCMRYLNLWDADLKKDLDHSYNGYGVDEYLEKDNWIGEYMFHKCNALESVVLPHSVTEIGENTFQEAMGLKRICVGRSTSKYTRDLLQDLNGIEELVFLTDQFAKSESTDPWEAPIEQVWTLQSQIGDYMGDPGLTCRAQDICAPFATDAVLWALADAGHFFPSEYLQMESAEGIFEGNTDIKNFDEFTYFGNVTQLDHTFQRMTELESITLPDSIASIGSQAFDGCYSLHTLRIFCDSVPELAPHAFASLPDDFQILVPKALCKLYRTKWPEYADHINVDNSHYLGGDVLTVTVTEPNTLATALGLTITTRSTIISKDYVNSLKGDYSSVRRLKVVGPISGADIDVLNYLAGYCPWAMCRNYSGHLEYLDLYDANIVKSDCGVAGYTKNSISFMLTEDFEVFPVYADNVLPHHSFLRAYSLKTLILPRTCKQVNERALQECEALETLVIGDDMEDFNWNALDDDAMLTRMYLLAKKKVKMSTETGVWRWACNNYNPTFDAFYVRPSLFEEYVKDDAYTGSSWQRTNNVSKGAFEDDDSFAAFAAHAAATLDDLAQVYSVDGWFDHHTGVRDLTALGYTAVDTLRAADMQLLTKLEHVMLPVTLESIEDGVFAQSPELRYVDMLMCDSTMLVDHVKARGLDKLGIDTQQTLVYLPKGWGQAEGVNIVVASSQLSTLNAQLNCETFRLVDEKDYCVPYAFHAENVENTRSLPVRSTPYTLCLPYDLERPANTRVYALSDRNETSLVFHEIPADAKIEAFRPYLIKVNTNKRRRTTAPASLNTTDVQVPANPVFGRQEDTYGYSIRGTLATVSNSEACNYGAYVLQTDGDWHPVRNSTDAQKQVSIPPYRVYMLPGASNAKPQVKMQLEDGADGIEDIVTIDNDGTTRVYDLSGRELPSQPRHGVYIKNGKKYINK